MSKKLLRRKVSSMNPLFHISPLFSILNFNEEEKKKKKEEHELTTNLERQLLKPTDKSSFFLGINLLGGLVLDLGWGYLRDWLWSLWMVDLWDYFHLFFFFL